MARRSVSQAQVASTLGLTQPQVSRRLSGAVEFSASELSKLSKLLDVPVSAFFG